MYKPKIVILYDRNGCCWWRSYLPHLHMQKEGLADVRFIELKRSTKEEMSKALEWGEFLHMVGPMDMDGIELVHRCQSLGIKFVADYDDLHFNCSPWNPKYKYFGTEEVKVMDHSLGQTQWLWADGKDGFDLKKNKFKFQTYKKILQTADIITTPSLYLKTAMEEISEYAANIKVMPNAIDFDQWKPLSHIRDNSPLSPYKDKFRFGWAVSGSHGEDWITIRPVLLDFLKSHPDAKFVCIGDTYMDIKSGLKDVEKNIEWYPWSDLWEGHYQFRMPLLGLDCAIAPLADTEFNKCKSPLKWAEYAAFGWPVIAQNMTPYKEHIQNGQTGLLANTKEEWLLALNQLYSDKELRSKLRFNALISAKSLFDIKEVIKDWYEMYTNFDKCKQVTSLVKTND